MEDGGLLERIMLAECHKIEFQLSSDSCFVWDFEINMDLLIDIFNVFKRREGNGFDLL